MEAGQFFGHVYDSMTQDMYSKLGNYQHSLQARYGDPRVYEMQQEEIAQRNAMVAHAEATDRASALSSLYERGRDEVRAAHRLKKERQSARGGKTRLQNAPVSDHTPPPAAPGEPGPPGQPGPSSSR